MSYKLGMTYGKLKVPINSILVAMVPIKNNVGPKENCWSFIQVWQWRRLLRRCLFRQRYCVFCGYFASDEFCVWLSQRKASERFCFHWPSRCPRFSTLVFYFSLSCSSTQYSACPSSCTSNTTAGLTSSSTLRPVFAAWWFCSRWRLVYTW